MRRALLYVGGWLAAVVLATAVGFAAVGLVGGDVGGPAGGIMVVADPVTPTASPTSTAKPHRTKTATPGADEDTSASSGGVPASTTATQVTDAGSVTARCRSGARLVSWSPKNGWSVVEVLTAGTSREVVFGDGTSYVRVRVVCGTRGPVFDVERNQASPSASPTPTPSDTMSVPSDPDAK